MKKTKTRPLTGQQKIHYLKLPGSIWASDLRLMWRFGAVILFIIIRIGQIKTKLSWFCSQVCLSYHWSDKLWSHILQNKYWLYYWLIIESGFPHGVPYNNLLIMHMIKSSNRILNIMKCWFPILLLWRNIPHCISIPCYYTEVSILGLWKGYPTVSKKAMVT